jgi:hypothetical protein
VILKLSDHVSGKLVVLSLSTALETQCERSSGTGEGVHKAGK